MLDALSLAALGPAGPVAVFAACGFDHSPALFTHIIGQKGYRGGGWWVGAGGSVAGGCSNLVHSAAWLGDGFTN